MSNIPEFFFIGFLFLNIPSVFAETAEKYLDQGNDAYKQGNYDQAIHDFTKAIDINPNLAKAYDNRGAAYAKEGSLNRAIDDFTLAIANDPKDVKAYKNRALGFSRLKEYDKAWLDVFMIEGLGSAVDPHFYKDLKKVSGKDQ